MSKAGRNELCPCGSGKKYKKCCESKDASAAAERARASAAAAARRIAESRLPPSTSSSQWETFELPVDKLSNSVPRLIREKRLDEALAVCEQLRVEFPDEPDWVERSAEVHDALGNTALAIDFYRRSLAFTERPEQRDFVDEEIRDIYRARISALEAQLGQYTAP